MKTTMAQQWLSACSGCEMVMMDMGEELLGLLREFEPVHMPLLMDHKHYGADGGGTRLEIPQADVGIVSGAVSTEEHLRVLAEMRRSCRVLIALGTCATHGGIPALANCHGMDQVCEALFPDGGTGEGSPCGGEGVPRLLDRVYAVDEKAEVDMLVPGCPPNPRRIIEVLRAAAEEESSRADTDRSVCDTCPAARSGMGGVARMKRFLLGARQGSEGSMDGTRCFLELGFLCMGPVTAAGCAVDGVPGCMAARVPCRGCFGPVRPDGNQLVEMMNALASNGVDWRSVPDRRSLLRFSGAHGLLRPSGRR